MQIPYQLVLPLAWLAILGQWVGASPHEETTDHQLETEEFMDQQLMGRNWRAPARLLSKREDGPALPDLGDKHKLVCYYNNQGAMRTRKGLFTVDMIEPHLCTHLIYLALGLNEQGEIKSFTPRVDFEEKNGQNMVRRMVALKNGNPALKTMLAVEGNSEKYSPLVASETTRARFIKSALEFLAKYELDGLDLIWKYPNDPRGKEEDKENYVRLVGELKRAFQPKGYLLSAALPVGTRRIEQGVNVKAMSDQLDFINLMSYDYNGGWDNETGVHAPLHESSLNDRNEADRELNVNWSVQHWISKGADPRKLMLGITTYGRSFNLASAKQNGINSPISGTAKPGPYTKNDRLLGYNELCEAMTEEPSAWRVVRDPEYQVPYAVKGTQWVGYEDAESARLKAKFALARGLGGVTVTSLCMDDFSGECKDSAGEPYPITRAIRSELAESARRAAAPKPEVRLQPTNEENNESSYGGPTTTDEEAEPAESTETPKRPKGDRKPARGGQAPVCGTDDQWWFPGPTCQEYYDCTTGEAALKQCKKGLVWRQSRLWCDYPQNVPECAR